jgi:hypothetical protein
VDGDAVALDKTGVLPANSPLRAYTKKHFEQDTVLNMTTVCYNVFRVLAVSLVAAHFKKEIYMILNLKNGATVEGTLDEISRFVERHGSAIAMGPHGTTTHYNSSSKGLIPISNMNDVHARNAVCVIYREWVAGLNKLPLEDFLVAMEEGITDETFLALVERVATAVEDDE